ncbi:chromosome segregation protein SMC [Candidatus Micrarchaeota archaeon]|nr:chromosome segregation protein SMC [Candidatus Micrarchaeota archaeon]
MPELGDAAVMVAGSAAFSSGARIEKIRLKNFKSFRNTTIPLSSGYTAIVGPNGSGKSNVVDSLVFALGGASIKSLRAGRLTDLVHHEAADNTAVVEIKLRHGENTHIVSRSIDKSGQSVFRLDGRRVTRNALEDFLVSVSVHPDGHNVIMQGDVTNIVKMTPLQRREIIDEVSGIAEYESKKGEALRELEVVEEKIREADIVLIEKTSFLQVLAKEKKEAERFNELSSQKRSHKGTLAKKEYADVERQYKQGESSLQKLRERAGEFEQKRQESASEVEKLDAQLDGLMHEIMEESEKRQSGVRAEIETTKSSLAVVEEKIRAAKENVDTNLSLRQRLSSEVSELGNKIKSKENELETLSIEAGELHRQIGSKLSSIEELKKTSFGMDSSFGEKYTQLVKLNGEIDSAKDVLYKLDGDLRALNERLNLKRAAFEAKGAELEKVRQQEEVVKKRISELEDRRDSLEKQLKQQEELLAGFSSQELSESKQLYTTEADLKAARDKFTELDSRISVMHHLSGKTRAVEAVMRNASLRGILGTVADVITFDPKYSAAVQAAAGQRMFHIITRTADDATDAVNFLKKEKIGRASFMPLDKVRSYGAEPQAGSLGLVKQFIRYDKSYEPAVDHVFGATLLVEDMGAAKRIGFGKHRMVTLDGDLCDSSGVITGGYSKQGVTTQELRELDEAKKRLEGLEKQRSKLAVSLDSCRTSQRESLEKKSETELKLREAVVIINQWNQRVEEFEQLDKKGGGDARDEITAMEKALKNKNDDRAKLEKSLSQLVSRRSSLTEVFERPEVKKLGEDIRSQSEELEKMRSQEAELKSQCRTLQLEIERVLIENQNSLRSRVNELGKGLEEAGSQLGQLDSQRAGLISDLKEKEERARQLAGSLGDLFKKKESLEEAKRLVLQRMGRYESQLNKLREEITQFSIARAKIEARYEEMTREMEQYKDAPIVEKPLEEVRRQLAKIEAELLDLGHVNMKALEMYGQYLREVDEIRERAKKLLQEKQAVLGVVEEIEQKKINSFIETFEALNRNFNEYFSEFYPEEGSRASLRLENPDKPLESGLIIEASPAGKKPHTIDELSGGEKTIVAIAFLFGVQAYRPSPFYVLDEVDAALDPANSERVARMLRKFASRLQFVVVTHNPPVTRYADQIIGVHLAKDGSSIIEVDLKNYGEPQEIDLSKVGTRVPT